MKLARALIALWLGAAGAGVAATPAAWTAAYARASGHYAAGALAPAEAAAREALALARAGAGDNQSFVASSLNLLALVRRGQAQGVEAVALLREALALSRPLPAARAHSAALALNLGDTLAQLGHGSEALQAYGEGLAIAEAEGETAAEVRAALLAALARLHAARGEAAAAGRYNERLLADAAGLPAAARADALERQARLAAAQGALADARAALEQALALREAAPAADAAALLRTVSSLAHVLGRLGEHDLAAPWHRRAVALIEAGAAQDVALAGHLNELGLWHLQRREFDDAQALLQRALAMVQAQDAAGLQSARIAANLAQLHEARQDHGRAQALYRQAQAAFATHGELPEALVGQAQALNYLAGQDYRRRRLAEAERQFLQALELLERAEGRDAPQLLTVLDNLADLYRAQRRGAQARQLAERAAALRRAQAQQPGGGSARQGREGLDEGPRAQRDLGGAAAGRVQR